MISKVFINKRKIVHYGFNPQIARFLCCHLGESPLNIGENHYTTYLHIYPTFFLQYFSAIKKSEPHVKSEISGPRSMPLSLLSKTRPFPQRKEPMHE